MSVDERLRASLQHDPAYAPSSHDEVLESIVRRAERRQRIRIATVAAALIAACLLVAVIVPRVLAEGRADAPPADQTPTHTLEWQLPDRSTPIDGSVWRTRILTRAERLAALDGTGLEQEGPGVYDRADMVESHSYADLRLGDFAGAVQSHNRGALSAVPAGSFRVRGDEVIITFADSGSRAVFRWTKPERTRLELTLVRTDAPPMFGAPAEVFLRMWSAAPFTLN